MTNLCPTTERTGRAKALVYRHDVGTPAIWRLYCLDRSLRHRIETSTSRAMPNKQQVRDILLRTAWPTQLSSLHNRKLVERTLSPQALAAGSVSLMEARDRHTVCNTSTTTTASCHSCSSMTAFI